MGATSKKKVTGYDKYVDWKIFSIPIICFFLILLLPTPYGMKDVGTEYHVGPKAVVGHLTKSLFQQPAPDVEQWQLLIGQMMEKNMRMGALSREGFLKRKYNWCKKNEIKTDEKNFNKAIQYVKANISAEVFDDIMREALKLRKDGLKYETLTGKDKKAADKGAWHIKVAVAMGALFLNRMYPASGGSVLHWTHPGCHGCGNTQGGCHVLLERCLLGLSWVV